MTRGMGTKWHHLGTKRLGTKRLGYEMTGTPQPHQNRLLLSGQQVVFIPGPSGRFECPQYLFSSVRMVIFGDALKIYKYQNEA